MSEPVERRGCGTSRPSPPAPLPRGERGGRGDKPVLGLIGGMGSGKSRVAAEFARHEARVIDGDKLGHEALGQPAIREALVQRWGPQVLNEQGAIDRRRVGTIVFADPAELRALEALSFPWIERRIEEEIAAAKADPAVRLIVLDAAIMLETGWNRVCDGLVFVEAPRSARLARLAAQRGWNEADVAARERNQLPLAEKASRADAVIDNGGTEKEVAEQVERLLAQWELTSPQH